MVSDAIAKGDVNAIHYFLGLKYVEAFAQLATSNQQRTVIVPADLGGLAGLVESLRALNTARHARRRALASRAARQASLH